MCPIFDQCTNENVFFSFFKFWMPNPKIQIWCLVLLCDQNCFGHIEGQGINQLFFYLQIFWIQFVCQLIQIWIAVVLICKSKLFKEIVAAKQTLLMISVPGAFWNGQSRMKILETVQISLSNITQGNSSNW